MQIGKVHKAQLVSDFRAMVLARVDDDGRITPKLQLELNEVEQELVAAFDAKFVKDFDAIWAGPTVKATRG